MKQYVKLLKGKRLWSVASDPSAFEGAILGGFQVGRVSVHDLQPRSTPRGHVARRRVIDLEGDGSRHGFDAFASQLA